MRNLPNGHPTAQVYNKLNPIYSKALFKMVCIFCMDELRRIADYLVAQ
jgi:hypothetical protein